MKPTILADSGATDPIILEVRTRFVADFPMRCDAGAKCIEATRVPEERAAAAASLRTMAHRLAGLAGVVGFSRVSALAADLEDVAGGLEAGTVGPEAAQAVLESLRTAFTQELSGADAAAAPAGTGAADRGDILLAEDDADQRAVVSRYLTHAGYTVTGVEAGHLVLAAARAATPSVVLLDVEMPGLDGYSVCRELKADPSLSTVPIVFMTSRARLDDRLAGLALGADDYLVKPVDPRELVIRLERVQARDTARAEGTAAVGVLSYEDFVPVARHRLARAACALVLVRAAPERLPQVLAKVRDEIRRADLAAAFDRTHVVLLLPGVTGTAARHRVGEIVQGLHDRGFDDVTAGVAAARSAGAATLPSLLAEADEALAQARCFGRLAALAGELSPTPQASGARTVLVADDDPDVTRILDAQFRAAGYDTALTFDGAAAVEAIEHSRPDVVLLDLMMPNVSGFEVLGRLQHADRRPKVIVLSARGREDDVTRAFELGADDYVVKPFNPQELLARVARLLR